MRYDIVSLFPDYFEGPFTVSMIKRAREKGLIEINQVDIREFGKGNYKQVDDRPYGGGPGMVLMAEPVVSALRSVKKESSHVIYLSPQGKPLTAKRCRELAQKDHLVILCGHYEGVDQRAIDLEVDEEISIGDYVLTSGCPAAIVLVDATSRFIPGVIGNEEAANQDSFENGKFEAPLFTRPPSFEGKEVPPILSGGHHMNIEAWKNQVAAQKMSRVRPDLATKEKNR